LKKNSNPYLPMPVTIKKIVIENQAKDLKTFDLVFDKQEDAKTFMFVCGQFAMVSIDGVGEAPFGIASSPMDKGMVQVTVKRYKKGIITTALHNLEEGAKIGLRAPFGNGYPMKDLETQNILLLGGGFALTTLRSVAMYVLHKQNRSHYGKLTMLVAARDPGEILYKNDIAEWLERKDVAIVQTIDSPAKGWSHKVGFAAAVLKEMAPLSKETYALVCGPGIMIKTCTDVLLALGFSPERILNSLEMRMKCGIGKCGRCNIGSKYVCCDGPVFSLKQLRELSKNY